MSYIKCNCDNLSSTLTNELSNYSDEITARVKKAVDTTGKEVNEGIKNHITFNQNTGDYIKSFRVSKTYEDRYKKYKTWHVINGQYRLTHLLENGHALPQGGRTKAYPHIKYGEEIAEARMEELARKAVKDAGR